jgi:hypothetical protein
MWYAAAKHHDGHEDTMINTVRNGMSPTAATAGVAIAVMARAELPLRIEK